MSRKQSNSGSPPVYRNKPLEPRLADSYATRTKYVEPTVCPACNAVFHKGHWQWLAPPPSPHLQECPACRRVRERMPAGYLHLEGAFVASHIGDIRAVVRSVESREKGERPLNRIIETAQAQDHVTITTTDAHLARSIGEALHHAYKGSLEVHYGPDENLARVTWRRDN